MGQAHLPQHGGARPRRRAGRRWRRGRWRRPRACAGTSGAGDQRHGDRGEADRRRFTRAASGAQLSLRSRDRGVVGRVEQDRRDEQRAARAPVRRRCAARRARTREARRRARETSDRARSRGAPVPRAARRPAADLRAIRIHARRQRRISNTRPGERVPSRLVSSKRSLQTLQTSQPGISSSEVYTGRPRLRATWTSASAPTEGPPTRRTASQRSSRRCATGYAISS